MANRLTLHEELCEFLGSRNVYFQPPSSIKMKYPAIVYSRSDLPILHADDENYKIAHRYSVTIIDPDPDSEYVDRFLKLKNTAFQQHFADDNLNHDVFTIYY